MLSFRLGYCITGWFGRSFFVFLFRLFLLLLLMLLGWRLLGLHRKAPVEALYVREDAFPVWIFHAYHVFDVQ